MSLIQRWFGKRKFTRLQDSYTLTYQHKLTTLCQWVAQQVGLGKNVLALSHFQSTFVDLQEALQEADVDFEILAEPVSEDQLMQRFVRPGAGDSQSSGPRVILTMAQMLIPTDNSASNSIDTSTISKIELALMVAERYPIRVNDQRLELFASQLPARVAIGYIHSFDDPILRHLMGQKFIDLLKQLGLGENDLVSSVMTHQGFQRRLRKTTAHLEHEQKADSPKEWLELNLKPEDDN